MRGLGRRLNKAVEKHRRVLVALAIAWFVGIIVWYLHSKNFAVLNPAGLIAVKERRLMIVTVLLGLVVVIPVYIMLGVFAWRYREGNKKARYSPELSGNRWAETAWWGIPTVIILALSIITWQSSHALDPRRSLDARTKPLTIQVVALDWKWLFIYPEQGVASVNYVELPVGTPVEFDITADAPMNSFWIPRLGSQIYAMPGMSTQLHLIADKVGAYGGSSANISGRGFSGMRFTAEAVSQYEFDTWLQFTKQLPDDLSMKTYQQLVKPSENNPTVQYASVEPGLYGKIILKYMAPIRGQYAG